VGAYSKALDRKHCHNKARGCVTYDAVVADAPAVGRLVVHALVLLVLLALLSLKEHRKKHSE
jgi:hypothetical protein